MPTAGVWDQGLGKLLRLLPTAGVGDQGLGAPFRLLPTAGVCDQHLGAVLRLLLTAGIWLVKAAFLSSTIGPINLVWNVKIWALWPFSRDIGTTKWSKSG